MMPIMLWAGPLLQRAVRPLTIGAGVLALSAGSYYLMSRSVQARDARRYAAGVQAERLRVHDSVNAVLARAAAAATIRNDTVVRTVTERVTRWRTDTAWRADTVRVAGDTAPRIAVPVATLERADSTIRACELLVGSCSEQRRALEARIAGLLAERETRLGSVRVGGSTIPDSLRRAGGRFGWKSVAAATITGAVGGYVAARRRPRETLAKPP